MFVSVAGVIEEVDLKFAYERHKERQGFKGSYDDFLLSVNRIGLIVSFDTTQERYGWFSDGAEILPSTIGKENAKPGQRVLADLEWNEEDNTTYALAIRPAPAKPSLPELKK